MERVLPYNCPYASEWFENYNNIRKYLANIGGISYEILKESGIENLELIGIFNERYWLDDSQIEESRSDDRIIALEVYIDLRNDSNLDKTYIFYSHTNDYYSIYKDGVIKKGKLVLTKEKAAKWAEKGYKCIISQMYDFDQERFSEYKEIFGENVSCRNMKPWRTKNIVASRGYKEVFLLLDYKIEVAEGELEHILGDKHQVSNLGDYYLEVDFYAIDTCFCLIKWEQNIRDFYNPFFRIENVDRMDQNVKNYLSQEIEDVFLREMGYDIDSFPDCYRELAYLTAYIKYYYPDVCKVTDEILSEKEECKSLGISVETDVLYGASGCKKDAYLIRNRKAYGSVTSFIYGVDIENPYGFYGKFSLLNAGVALSEIGLSVRSMLESCVDKEREYAVISMPAYVPNKEEICEYIKNIQENGETFKNTLDVEIFEQLDLDDLDGEEIIKKAVQMAGIPHVDIVPRPLAITAAYENYEEKNKLSDGQCAFVYDWDDKFFSISLIQQKKSQPYILWHEVIDNPATNKDPYIAEGKTLLEAVKSAMYEKMYQHKEMLKAMNLTIENKDAWKKLYDSAEKVMNQLRNDKVAKFVLENDWASIGEELEDDTFKKIFLPYYCKTENLMKNILSRFEIKEYDIAKIYVSGKWGNYSGVWDRLQRFVGENKVCIMGDTNYAAVKGAAYLGGTYKK